jgi:putative ABC transport system permease protein
MEYHLEREIAENIAAGMSPNEARAAALRAFGNPALLRDQTRATWGWNKLEAILHDLRYSIRTLTRTPGFTIIAILVMGFGIGANIALFTVIRSVLLKPLPFRDADRLMMAFEQTGDEPYNPVSGGTFAEWKKQNRTFTDLAIIDQELYNVSGNENQLPERLDGANCTRNFFPMLGVTPALGHSFTAADDSPSANGVVMFTWSFWQRRFGGNPAILNQTIRMNRRPYTVIGILPRWFSYPYANVQLWTPAYHDKPPSWITSFSSHEFLAVGHLKPGVTMSQAGADLSAISGRIHEGHAGNAQIGKGASVIPLLDNLVGDYRNPLYMLMCAAGCLLLVACMNVAGLLVARSAANRKNLAIRAALGAGRARLLRERLMESFLLCAGGAAAGMVLAYAAIQWLVYARADMPRAAAIHPDGVVATFAIGIVVACAAFTALMSFPAASSVQLSDALQSSGRGSSDRPRARLRRVLLILEIGVTTVLLVSAGLLLKSYWNLRTNDMGCDPRNVLTMRLGLFGGQYNDPAYRANFYAALLARVRSMPGVQAAGFAQAVPGQGYWADRPFTVVERAPLPPDQTQSALIRFTDPGYFAAMGIPLLRGRSFDPGKHLGNADEAVISKSFADEYLPGEDPIGRHLNCLGHTSIIVGVVGDTRYAVAEPSKPVQYYSIYAGTENNGTLFIRSSRNVEQLALPVQRTIAGIDRDLPVSKVLTMEQLLGDTTSDSSFNASVLLGFSVISLMLVAAGIFGVLSYLVAQRTAEIGVRMALGAPRAQVLRNVLLDGMRPALLGLTGGLIASAAAGRLVASMLYNTAPQDPAIFAGVAVTLLLITATACTLPAWRASRVDPMRALRTD